MAEPIEGLKELSKKLEKLGQIAGSKVFRQSAMLATKKVLEEAKRTVPQGKRFHKTHKGRIVAPGFASRNLARKSKLSKNKSTVRVLIGVKPEAYYALSFLELGTKHIPKQPWLVKALESKQNEVISEFKKRLKAKIEKEAKK